MKGEMEKEEFHKILENRHLQQNKIAIISN